MEAVSLLLSPCGSLSLVAGLEATHKSVAIYGQSQSPAVLIGSRGRSNILHCELGQQHPLCVCSFTRVHTGSLAGTDLADLARLAGQQAPRVSPVFTSMLGEEMHSAVPGSLMWVLGTKLRVPSTSQTQQSPRAFIFVSRWEGLLVRLVSLPRSLPSTCKCDAIHGFCLT